MTPPHLICKRGVRHDISKVSIFFFEDIGNWEVSKIMIAILLNKLLGYMKVRGMGGIGCGR